MTTSIHQTVAKRLRRFFGHFPQVVDIRDRLLSLVEYENQGEEPDHVLLLGEPGTGKSTLLSWIVRSFPVKQHEAFTEIPVVYVEVPSSCSIKKLAGEVLRAMNSPFWKRGDEQDRTDQVKLLLEQCKTRVVIFDEVNHLVDRGQAKTHELVADWIKQLSSQVKLPLILAGVNRSRTLLEANDQLADRFREELELRPLGIGTNEQAAEFSAVMRAFEQMLEGIPHIDLTSMSVLKPLAFATGGRLRAIRKLLVRAVENVGKGKAKCIDLAALEMAFLEVIFKGAKPESNPFSPTFRGTPLIKAGEPFAPSRPR